MKKSEVITIRVDEELKDKIKKRADYYKWSVSQTIELILQAYFTEPDKEIEETVTEIFKITKKNQNIIYNTSKALDLNDTETINHIIDFYGAMWPIENRPY